MHGPGADTPGSVKPLQEQIPRAAGAGRKWGCEELRRKGLKICALLWQHCVNKRTGAPLVGDWVHPSGEPSGGPTEGSCGGPGVDMYWATRPSDFCLTHFALFAQVTLAGLSQAL